MFPLFLFKVSGSSMNPVISHGDIIICSILPYVFSNPKIGDLVVFLDKKRGERFVKRIQKIKKDTYFCTGDNSGESLDSRILGWVEKKDILGKVLYII